VLDVGYARRYLRKANKRALFVGNILLQTCPYMDGAIIYEYM